jgi:hypothetical protein
VQDATSHNTKGTHGDVTFPLLLSWWHNGAQWVIRETCPGAGKKILISSKYIQAILRCHKFSFQPNATQKKTQSKHVQVTTFTMQVTFLYSQNAGKQA